MIAMHLSPVYHSPFHIIHSAPKSRRSTFPEYYFEVNFQQDWSTGTQTVTIDGLCRERERERQTDRQIDRQIERETDRQTNRQTDTHTALYIRCGEAIDSDKPTTYHTLNICMSLIKSVP